VGASPEVRGQASARLTGVVGFAFEDVELGAVGQGVLEAELEEARLGPAEAFQQREQRDRLLALVPALEPTGQDADLVSKHHGDDEEAPLPGEENKYPGRASLPRRRCLPCVSRQGGKMRIKKKKN